MRLQASAKTARDLPEADEAVVVDLRAPGDFARGHARGAVSLPFSPRGLSQRLAVVVEPGTPVRLLTSEPRVASAALAQLENEYRVIGVIDASAWRQAGLLEESLRDISIETLAHTASSGDLIVLDVREPVEWETGYAPGAVLIPLGSLREQLEALPRDSLVAVICEAGVRSSTGASLLQAAGFPTVATVSEGMSGYRRAGAPVVFPKSQEQS
jgi:hydroxyacylglutathione hydrolase